MKAPSRKELTTGVTVIAILLAVTLSPAVPQPHPPAPHARTFEENHRLAEYYAAHGKVDAAIRYFERARQLDPEHYVNGYDLALAYSKTNAFDKARAQVNDMLVRQDKAELHDLAGAIEQQAGRPDAAVKEYQRAVQMDAVEKHVFDLANCLLHFKSLDRALAAFQYGVEKYPRSARMRVGLGVTRYARGEYDTAVQELCEGVDLDPTDSRPIYFLGKMYDISPAMANEVSQRLKRLVSQYPRNAAANYFYGLSLWKGPLREDAPDKLLAAERYLKRAIEIDPGLPEAHFQLGALNEQQGNFAEALSQFEEAVRLQPDSGPYHYRLAQAYRKLGQEKKAEKELTILRALKDRKTMRPAQ